MKISGGSRTNEAVNGAVNLKRASSHLNYKTAAVVAASAQKLSLTDAGTQRVYMKRLPLRKQEM